MNEQDDIEVRSEIPPRQEKPLTRDEYKRVVRARWDWTLAFNRVRAMPAGPDTDARLDRCERALAIIDELIAAQPTFH